MNFFESIKPKASRRTLMFLAAFVWTFAGGMLLFRGISFLRDITDHLWLKVILSAAAGMLFYLLLFSKISLKHTRRIINLKNDMPCLFSFFNIKSYILMTVMITSGILLRKSGLIVPGNLSVIYVTMGIPLLLSAFRFYYKGFNFNR